MGVARGNGIADPEQLESALRIIPARLWTAFDEGAMVEHAKVARLRLQFEIEVVERNGAVVDDDLVDMPFLAYPAIVAADDGHEAVVPALHRPPPVGACEVGIEFLKRPHVSPEVNHQHTQERR